MLSIVITLKLSVTLGIMTKFPLRLILSDIRSTYNVGSILRTADAAGIEHVYTCGYTPYPRLPNDERPPHIAASNTQAIAKTALGAELTLPISHTTTTLEAISRARHDGFTIIILEQAENSLNLYDYHMMSPVALVLGNEVTGVSSGHQALGDATLEIPMLGTKESLNVSVATAIAIYQLRFGLPQG